MIGDFFISISNTLKALGYLLKPWVFKYLFLSGLISLVTYSLIFTLIYYQGDSLGGFLFGFLGESIQYDWLRNVIEWLSRIVLFIGVVFIAKYIILIVTAPIMSLLSESVEKRHRGDSSTPQLEGGAISSMLRGVRIALSNLSRELLLTILLFLLGIIPGLAIVTTPLIFVVQSYYAGFGNFDFFMERRFKVKESRRFVSGNKGMAIGNGAIFLGLFLVPFVGAFIAPALCTVSATLSALERT